MSDQREFTIGRGPDNDIVVRCQQVSSRHAILMKTPEGLVIEDVDSRNGVFVNGNRIQRAQVAPGDVITLSVNYRLDWGNRHLRSWLSDRSETIHGNSPETTGSREWIFSLDGYHKDKVTIGRIQACDIVIEHPRISRIHATASRDGANWVIEDHGSANGTFVNGVRVRRATIHPESKVALAGIPVQLFITETKRKSAVGAGEASIEVENLSLAVPFGMGTKLLLKEINLRIPPSSFVGLIGPSGSGKTTLLQTINGLITPTSGSVRINGIDVHGNSQIFKGFIGYVPQDDIIHRELTVGSSVHYNASLRLPDMSREEREHEVKRVIKDLSLSGTEDTIIGSPARKGISGGQRKRVNLSQELITRPSILFLDEPCSGLDPKSEMDVMLLLRGLCDAGKTVVLTTHNPSQRNLDLMDYLLVLTYGGNIAYFGPPAEMTRYFGVTYPEDVFARLDDASPDHWTLKFRTRCHRQAAMEPPGRQEPSVETPPEISHVARGQLVTLCRRTVEIRIRDSLQTVILLLVPILIGGLLALIMSPIEAEGLMAPGIRTLYILVVAATFFGVLNSARDIVSERAIYRRESRVFLKDGNYLLSKVLVLGTLCAIQCALMLAITYPACDLQGSFFGYLGILLAAGLGGTVMGLLVSSLVSTETVAMTFVPAILVPQIILGGFVVKYNEMTELVKLLAGATISRWGFEAALLLDGRATSEGTEAGFDQTAAAMIGFREGNLGVDILAMLIWFILVYLLILAGLKRTR